MTRHHDDEHAHATRHDLVERHLPLARRLARRFAHAPQDLEDLEQVAALGLVKAAHRFDAGRGAAFSTFAFPTIVGEIKHYCRDTGWAVHVPHRLKDRAFHVEQTTRRLTAERNAMPSPADVADELGVAVNEVRDARAVLGGYHAASLDAPASHDVGEDAPDSVGDLLGAPDDGYDRVEQRVAMEPALAELSDRDRSVLALRFEHEMSQAAIGERVGVSQVQISRILTRSFDTLRASPAI
jgi:RNA polymerase sigma-B factor